MIDSTENLPLDIGANSENKKIHRKIKRENLQHPNQVRSEQLSIDMTT